MANEAIGSAARKWRPSVLSAIFTFIVGIVIVILGLQASRIVDQRGTALEAGKNETENLVVSLSQHATLIFRGADTILNGLVERLQAQDHKTTAGEGRLVSWFRKVMERQPQIVGFLITDNSGEQLLSSEAERRQNNVSQYEYFREHVDGSSGLYIGAPIQSPGGERWVIPVSRRYVSADGHFGGVVVLLLDMAFFQTFYEQFNVGKDGAILLMSANMKLLVRRPFAVANIGRDMSQSNLVEALAQSSSGTVVIKSTTDGATRLNSYRRGEEYPFVVAVARSMDEILIPWRNRAIREVVQTAVLLIVILVSGRSLWHMTNRLTIAKQQLDTTISAMPQGLCLFDSEQRLVLANDRFRELYDYPQHLMRSGTPLHSILSNLFERGARQGEMTVQQYIDGLSPDGGETLFNINGRLISIARKPTPGGGWVASHEDITDHKLGEQKLARQAADLRRVNEYFETAINNLPQGICLFDADQRVVISNSLYASLYKLTNDEIRPGTTLQEILDRRAKMGTNLIVASDQYRSVNINKISDVMDLADGRTVSIRRQMLSDGGWLTTHDDITEQRRSEKRIAYLAAHDTLTGLPNRAFFNEALLRATEDATAKTALFLLDLDRFKAVNDTLGHAAGDQLLKDVADRLRSQIREDDVVARLGGDEFAILQKLESDGHEPAISLALRIIDVVSRPYELDGQLANIGTSIGIALAPEQGTDRSELMKKADLALYAVKAKGRNDFRIYDTEMMKVVEHQALLEAELAQAIERDELELYYQPVLDVLSNKFVGAEALVRWHHPQRGLLTPDKFIPLAEESGLIVQLGEWALQRGCREAAAWPHDQTISINVSPHQFNRGNLFDVVLCTLVETGLSPDRLELEIAESALVDDNLKHQRVLRQLKDIGITIVLDGFGAGYSSAQHLTFYPVDKIKIDKAFVQNVGIRRESSAIIASTLVLAQELDIKVTAEGVETLGQMQQLCRAGINFVQGNLIGRPVTVDEFLAAGSNNSAQSVA